jgi:molecular chaperone DnaK
MIVEKFIIPKLYENYKFSNLEDKMKSASGKFNAVIFKIIKIIRRR